MIASPPCATADVSVVIRAFNEAAHIDKLMQGIAVQSLQPREVILVDSGSTDDTVERARRHGARIVHIDKSDFTFGRALNIGCDAAHGELLVFASAHVFPLHHDWLERLLAPFDDACVVLSYGGQRGGTSNKYSEHRLFDRWFPLEPALPQQGYFCNNANCAVRRAVWERLRYDETLTGLEDLDWAKRAQEAGGVLAYEPEAAIAHVHDETWSQIRNRYRREAIALRKITPDVHFTLIDFIHMFMANVVRDGRVAMLHGVLRQEWLSVVRFRFNQFWGTWQGHNGRSEVSRSLRKRFYYPAERTPQASATAGLAGQHIDYTALQPAQPKDSSGPQ